jgi:hypothetical protein
LLKSHVAVLIGSFLTFCQDAISQSKAPGRCFFFFNNLSSSLQ